MVDIMVRAEDASKINRIVKRFDLGAYDGATIKSEIVKDKTEKVPKIWAFKKRVQKINLLMTFYLNLFKKRKMKCQTPMLRRWKKPSIRAFIREQKQIRSGY